MSDIDALQLRIKTAFLWRYCIEATKDLILCCAYR